MVGGECRLRSSRVHCSLGQDSANSPTSLELPAAACRTHPVPPVQPMPAAPFCVQRVPHYTLYHEPLATETGLGAKLWDVRASQKGSPRNAFSGMQSAALSSSVRARQISALRHTTAGASACLWQGQVAAP